MRKLIITAFMACSLLTPLSAADYEDYENKPKRVSMCSIFKTALVGIGLLSSPEPVKGKSPSDLLGCYIGTVDTEGMKNTNTISINRMIYSTPNYNYNYQFHEYNSISMIMNATCSSNIISNNIYTYCPRVTIKYIILCSQGYSLIQSGTTAPGYTAYLGWNPRQNNKYEELALCLLNFDGGLNLPDDAIRFADMFYKVISIGSCTTSQQKIR